MYSFIPNDQISCFYEILNRPFIFFFLFSLSLSLYLLQEEEEEPRSLCINFSLDEAYRHREGQSGTIPIKSIKNLKEDGLSNFD